MNAFFIVVTNDGTVKRVYMKVSDVLKYMQANEGAKVLRETYNQEALVINGELFWKDLISTDYNG